MKNYLHVTLYCFDLLLVQNLINSNCELKNQLYDYFSSNYAKTFNDSRVCILFILDELYSEQRDNFINQIGYDLLSLCNIPPVTIFLNKFSKNTVILDEFHNVLSMKNILHINHGMFSSDILPLLKDYYLDELNLYKSKKYIPILQHLLNHPVKNIEKINEDAYGIIYSYDITSMKKVLEGIETTRTDIEHYLDKLGLYESFKHEYQFITRNDLYEEIMYIMKIIFPHKFLSLYERQIIDYIMLYFYNDKVLSKSYKNNILHINDQNEQVINKAKDFLKKYYKRTIFEKTYKNNKDSETIQETKDIIKLLHNHQSDSISSELIGYIGDSDTVDFNSFFVKPTMKTHINPSIFINNEKDGNNDLINTENHESKVIQSCNLVLKTNDKDDIKSVSEIEQYLECVMDDIYNKAHSFIVSEFVNFKYEQRCFFRNGRIIGTTPCARKISFLHCYPNGRIHPYFVDNHNDDIDNLKLDRKMAAEMAWFAKAAARDYDQLQLLERSDNQSPNRCGTIDVGYDMDKKEWKIIEIHHFEGDIFQSNAGLYGMNPFLFNPYNSNIQKIDSLNNDMLKINWDKFRNDKNLLLIDLLEIKEKHQIPSNNLLLILPSRSLKSIYSFRHDDFNLFKNIECDLKLELINSIKYNWYHLTLYIYKHIKINKYTDILKYVGMEYQYKFNWKNIIDVLCIENKISIKLPSGSIDITGFESNSTELIIKSNCDYKEIKIIKIEPYQTYYHLVKDYLCELIVAQCADIYLQFINNEKTYKD